MITRVTHLTTAHARFDTRIFLKECRSLVRLGFDVSLVVADGKGDEQKEGVSICDVGVPKGRLDRMLFATQRAFKRCVALDSDIYHFHDPELIPVGRKLKRLGKIVIFDSHEDVPKQVLGKPYLNPIARKTISRFFSFYESVACREFDAIVAATPSIRDKFLRVNPRTVDIRNYPLRDELSLPSDQEHSGKAKKVCYVGGISIDRGAREMVRALEHLEPDLTLELAGPFSERGLEAHLGTYEGWSRVTARGVIGRDEVGQVLRSSIAGLVTLHPAENYLDSLPIKMFEYMSAGIPVIASNFPLWVDIIETSNCGLCVDPTSSIDIARAISYLVENPGEARQMGINGRDAVLARYNWDLEERKLQDLYSKVLDGSA